VSIKDVAHATKVFAEALEVQRTKRDQYWMALKRVRQEYTAKKDGIYNPSEFYYWLQRKYGIKVLIVNDNISADYEIVDDSKYLMFCLKYMTK
jgi:hypothetical protein